MASKSSNKKTTQKRTKQKKVEISIEGLAEHVSALLTGIGEDVSREGLKPTPVRYAKALTQLTSGYRADINTIINDAIYHEDINEIVLIRDIELYSLCEHHLLPFFGKAHVAYLPRGKIIGLSKIPRIVDVYSRRLQVQERLTTQISEKLMEILNPAGVAVIIEAYHLCMMMRGVEKQNSKTVTSSMLGEFRKNPTTRKELLHLLNGLSLS
jgi:GTP cyclohydrolase IA